jgi:hypothetical protein
VREKVDTVDYGDSNNDNKDQVSFCRREKSEGEKVNGDGEDGWPDRNGLLMREFMRDETVIVNAF